MAKNKIPAWKLWDDSFTADDARRTREEMGIFPKQEDEENRLAELGSILTELEKEGLSQEQLSAIADQYMATGRFDVPAPAAPQSLADFSNVQSGVSSTEATPSTDYFDPEVAKTLPQMSASEVSWYDRLPTRSPAQLAQDAGALISSAAKTGLAGMLEAPANLYNLSSMSPVGGVRWARAAGVPLPARMDSSLAEALGSEGLRETADTERGSLSEQSRAATAGLDDVEGFFPTLGYLATNPGATFDQAAIQAGQLLPSTLGGGPTGMVLAQAGMAGSEAANEAEQRVRAKGGTEAEVAAARDLAFAISAGGNAILPNVIPHGKALEKLLLGQVQKKAGQVLMERIGSAGGKAAAVAAGETAAETLAEVNDAVAVNVAAGDPWNQDTGKAAALGFAMGAGMSTAPAAQAYSSTREELAERGRLGSASAQLGALAERNRNAIDPGTVEEQEAFFSGESQLDTLRRQGAERRKQAEIDAAYAQREAEQQAVREQELNIDEEIAATQKEVEEEAGFRTIERDAAAPSDRVERLPDGTVERVPVQPAAPVTAEQVVAEQELSALERRAKEQENEKLRRRSVLEGRLSSREKKAAAAEQKKSDAELKAQVVREQQIADSVLDDMPNATPNEIEAEFNRRLNEPVAPAVEATVVSDTQKRVEEKLKKEQASAEARQTRTTNARRDVAIAAARRENPEATPAEIAAIADAKLAGTEGEAAPVANENARERARQMGLGMAGQEAAAHSGLPESDVEGLRRIGEAGRSIAARQTKESVGVENLLAQGKLIITTSADFVGRNDTGRAGEYDPDTNRMYIYLDNLSNKDIVQGILEEIGTHESTHLGSLNSREGRSAVMSALMGDGDVAGAAQRIRDAASNGNKIAQAAESFIPEGERDGAVGDLELLAYFTNAVRKNRGGTLGSLRGVASDMVANVRGVLRDKIGLDLDITINDLANAVSDVTMEAARTDTSGPINTVEGFNNQTLDDSLGMVLSTTAKEFPEQNKNGRVYKGMRDGKRRFVISDKEALTTHDPETIDAILKGEEVPLGEVLQHQRLYDNLPWLMDGITVRMDDTIQSAQFEPTADDPRRGTIALSRRNAAQLDTLEARNTILHEVQHAVQNEVGLSSGANIERFIPSKVKSELKRLNKALDAVIARFDLTAALESIPPAMRQEVEGVFSDRSMSLPEKREYILRSGLAADSSNRAVSTFAKNVYAKARQEQNDAARAYNEAYERAKDAYARAYGEAEARTTEQTSDLTQEELDSRPFEARFGEKPYFESEPVYDVNVEDTYDADSVRVGTQPPKRRSASPSLGMLAKHGSPHSFTPEQGNAFGVFRDDKIGNGEGAQAFGWGHYATEDHKTADRHYRERLVRDRSTDSQYTVEGKLEEAIMSAQVRAPVDLYPDPAMYPPSPEEIVARLESIASHWEREVARVEKAIDEMMAEYTAADDYVKSSGGHQSLLREANYLANTVLPERQAEADAARKAKEVASFSTLRQMHSMILGAKDDARSAGEVYYVEIPEKEELADWDAPLEKQSQLVQDVIMRVEEELPPLGHRSFMDHPRQLFSDWYYRATAAVDSEKELSKLLHRMGLPGHYFQPPSRRTVTSNFVIYDPSSMTIVGRDNREGSWSREDALSYKSRSDRLREEQIAGAKKRPSLGMAAAAEATNMSTEGFKRWWRNGKVKNKDGSPMRLFHGTRAAEDYSEFRIGEGEIGIHVGTAEQAGDPAFVGSLYGRFDETVGKVGEGQAGPRIHPVHINLQNPLRVEADDFGMGPSLLAGSLAEALDAAGHRAAGNRMLDLASEARKTGMPDVEAFAAMRSIIEEAGYDGLVYRNTAEGTKMEPTPGESPAMSRLHYPYGAEEHADSYVVFHPNQIKSVNNSGEFSRHTNNTLGMASPKAMAKRAIASARAIVDTKSDKERLYRLLRHQRNSNTADIAGAESVFSQLRKDRAAHPDPVAYDAAVTAALDGKPDPKFKENFPVAAQIVEDFRNEADANAKDIVRGILKDAELNGRDLTAEENSIVNKLLDNLGKYTHRAYSTLQGGQVGALARKERLEALDLLRAGSKDVPRRLRSDYDAVVKAADYLSERLSIPPDAELEMSNIDALSMLYDTWVGDSSKVPYDNEGGKQAKKDAMIEAIAAMRDRIGEGVLNEKAYEAIETLMGVHDNSPYGKISRGTLSDTGVMKRRNQIPPVIRELLGEFTDPSSRILTTLAEQSGWLARQKMLTELAENSNGILVASPQYVAENGRGEFTKKLDSSYGAVAGWYATPETFDSITDLTKLDMSWREALSVTGQDILVPAGKAVRTGLGGAAWVTRKHKALRIKWNPWAWTRDIVGSPLFLIQNGNFHGSSYAKGLAGAKDYIGSASSSRITPTLEEVIRWAGVESARIGEIQHIYGEDLANILKGLDGDSSGLKEYWTKADRTVSAGKAVTDNWTRIANFYARVQDLSEFYDKKGESRTREQILREAGEDTDYTNVSYGRIAAVAAGAEKAGISTYLPFNLEVWRTAMTNYAQAYADIQRARDPSLPSAAANKMLRMGVNRLVGNTLALSSRAVFVTAEKTALAMGIMSAAMYALNGDGEDDEEDKWRRRLLSDMNTSQDLRHTGFNEDGMPTYMPFGQIDPHGPITDVLRTAMTTPGTPQDRAAAVGKQLLELYIAPSWPGRVWRAATGREPESAISRTFPDAYKAFEKLATSAGAMPSQVQRSAFAAETFLPGFVSAWDPKAAPGDGANVADRVLNKMGLRYEQLRPEARLASWAYDANNERTSNHQELNSIIANQPELSETVLKRALVEFEQNEMDRLREVWKTRRTLEAWGIEEGQIKSMMKDAKFSERDIKSIYSDDPKAVISVQALERYVSGKNDGATRSAAREETYKENLRKLKASREWLASLGIELEN